MTELIIIMALLLVFYTLFRFNRLQATEIRNRRKQLLDRMSQPRKKSEN